MNEHADELLALLMGALTAVQRAAMLATAYCVAGFALDVGFRIGSWLSP